MAYAVLATTENGSDSRNDINNNFALAAPLASPAFTGTPTAPTASPSDNSTKVATTAYVDAATAAIAVPSCTSVQPLPDFFTVAREPLAVQGNTTGFCARVIIPIAITVQKISLICGSVSVAGTLKIGLFSEDGQTLKFSVTTASISGSGIVTTAVSSTSLAAGIYYLVVVPVSTANVGMAAWTVSTDDAADVLAHPTSEPVASGTITVTASTMPSTITPTAITYATPAGIPFRLDN